ncbi:unnamed protein product [Linum trigynum]|uniref:Retrotransposon Copia-like N-terminal domain-containing protein n=1 Tax=Linum trigynum TaxID=586398 RepID=A0AAV2DHL0_9ROSI
MATGTPATPPPGSGGGSGTSTGGGFQFGSFIENQIQGGRGEIQFGNPFYLNPNENLSQSLVGEALDGTYYSMWSRSMRLALKTKHNLGFIDGSIPVPPAGSDLFHLWYGCNTVVLCWIVNSLKKEIAWSVMNHENARILWEELKRRFGQPNALRIINLEDDIHACKQGDRTITQYYTEIKGFWEDYLQFSPIVPCPCAPNNPNPCPAVVAFQTKQETDYLIRFLRGLNKEYEVVKTQLLMMKPLPTVTAAVDDLLLHEQKLKGDQTRSKHSQSVALAVGNQSGRDQYKGRQEAGSGKLFCRYCKRTDHTIKDCWKLKKKEQEKEGFSGSISTDSAAPSSESTGSISDDGSSPSKGVNAFSTDEITRLKTLLQFGMDAGPLSPGSSPRITPKAYSVSQFLPAFPNHAGPSDPEEHWFGKTK